MASLPGHVHPAFLVRWRLQVTTSMSRTFRTAAVLRSGNIQIVPTLARPKGSARCCVFQDMEGPRGSRQYTHCSAPDDAPRSTLGTAPVGWLLRTSTSVLLVMPTMNIVTPAT